MHGRFEIPPTPGGRFFGFVDPSGGSSDSFSLAIAYRRVDGVVVLAALREVRPPFSPEDVVDEFSKLLRTYGVHVVQGDRYAGEWPVERFQKYGIRYEQSAAPKSDLYRDLLPILNSGRCELLDHPRLVAQLCQLERRTARSGKDSIDHPPGAFDDVANACAGALVGAAGKVSIDWRRGAEMAAAMPPNPRFQQHRGPGRHMQSRFADFYSRQIGERRYAQMRRGIVPTVRTDGRTTPPGAEKESGDV